MSGFMILLAHESHHKEKQNAKLRDKNAVNVWEKCAFISMLRSKLLHRNAKGGYST